jgi:hypothetical protein
MAIPFLGYWPRAIHCPPPHCFRSEANPRLARAGLTIHEPPPGYQARNQARHSQFQFRVAGTRGESYVVLGSSNLGTRTPLMTNTVPLYDFTDTNAATLPKRLYRAQLAQ